MSGMDYKRFMRYFYDPPPRYDDMSGASIWFLGKEYPAILPKSVSTKDHEDIVEIESSVDSHDASEATTSTSHEPPTSPLQHPSGTFDDAQHVSSDNLPSLSNDPADGGWPQPFLDDFESRVWMTYRSNFQPIPRSQDPAASSGMTFSVRLRNLAEREGFSSDTGWGCMIRSGQSLLSNALIMLHLGREWRRRPSQTLHIGTADSSQPSNSRTEASILSLFADDPSAPFSIHRFVSHGATACGTHPGQWFGPSATASCIEALSSSALPSAGLRVYVTPSSSEVFEDRFLSIACTDPTNPNPSTIQPTLILLGIRLGIDRITPVYHPALKSFFTYPQSLGIAGGRPSSSHYFVGCQGDLFLYLDPHETRPALPYHANADEYTQEEIDTCHTRRLRGLRISEVDPSMLIGFLIRDETDWEDWKGRVRETQGKAIVHVYKETPPTPGGTERKEAVDEVSTFDDEDVAADDGDDAVTVTGKD